MKILIDQPAGIGDILFIQKIVKELSSEGHEVFLPVKDSLSWMCDYLPTVTVASKCEGLRFDSTLKLDGCERLFPGEKIMKSKYILAGKSPTNYIDYLDITRNFDREEDLFKKIIVNKPYRLICPWFATPDKNGNGMLHMDIPMSKQINNVVMDIQKGYTLFDWLKVIQNAEEIYTTDSAIMFLIEKYECEAKKLVAYSRRSTACEVDYLFKKSWEYVCKN
jgi:hypothetical protein